MATAKQSSEDEVKDIEKKISELRTAKNELLAKTRPVNVELEKITQFEREYVDKLQRLRAEAHDREKQQQAVQRLIELEADMKRVKCENEALKREKETLKLTNSKCTMTINSLKQSLDESVKNPKSFVRKIAELNAKISALQQSRSADIPAGSRTGNSGKVTELQEQLHQTNEQLSQTKEKLNETQRHLSDVQKRLTVAEQVTAATQQRALQESDNSEQLQLELTPQHQPTGHTGLNSFSAILN